MTGDYVPPTDPEGATLAFDPAEMTLLAPGVRGYAIRDGDRVYVPWITAEEDGSGAVGRFIDSLHPCVCFPTIVSARLRGMLQRRGWRETREAGTDVWVHPESKHG